MNELGEFINELGEFINEVGEFINEVGEFINEVGEFINEIGEFIDEVGEFINEIGRFIEEGLLRGICGPDSKESLSGPPEKKTGISRSPYPVLASTSALRSHHCVARSTAQTASSSPPMSFSPDE